MRDFILKYKCISLIFIFTLHLPQVRAELSLCSTSAGREGVSEAFLKTEVRDASSLRRSNGLVISRLTIAGTKAEQWSGRHQLDVESFIESSQERVPGINKEALFNGMSDSDKGKSGDYKKLLNKASITSDGLLAFCQGKGAAGEMLKEILKEAGLGNVTLLNKDLTPEQLREVFQKVPGLLGFLHEIPGMADAVLAWELGALSNAQFKAQLKANLFHNGPAEGFWKLLAEVFMPGAMKKAEVDPGVFFAGTVFQPRVEGKLSYPSPISAEGVLHTIADRLSQGTTGGVVKIYYEIIGFTPPLRAISELLILNPGQTKAQFVALEAQIQRLRGNRSITAEQATALNGILEQAKNTLETFAEKTRAALGNYDALKQQLPLNTPIEQLTLNGTTFRAADLTTPEAKEMFIQKVHEVLLGIESQMGNPMTPKSD